MSIDIKVLDFLKQDGEAYKAGELAQKMGIDKAEIDKAIKSLKKEKKIISPKRCYYSAK